MITPRFFTQLTDACSNTTNSISSFLVTSHEQVARKLSTILAKIESLEQCETEVRGATSALIPIDGLDEAGQSSHERSVSTIGRRVNFATMPTLSRAEDNSLPKPLRTQTPQVLKDQRYAKCTDSCACCCHYRAKFDTPSALRDVFGIFLAEYSSPGVHCNDGGCRRARAYSVSITYHPPKYMLQRYFTMAMHYTPLGGPQFSLRMPRTVGWNHLLWVYALQGDIVAIQNIFSEGRASPYDVNPDGANVLDYTITNASIALNRFVIGEGADPEHSDGKGRKPVALLWQRAFAGQFGEDGISLVSSMLKGTDYLDTRRFTTLHKIVLGISYRELEEELLSNPASISIPDVEGRTPLAWATIKNDVFAVTTLLEYGADPNVANHYGNTCLHFVKSVAVCRLLLNANADINAQSKVYRRTPLHKRCKAGCDTQIIDLFVDAGAEVDARDANQETPLLNAIFDQHTAVASRLIDLGANINADNIPTRDSAIHFAVCFGHHDILSVLLQKGADYLATNVHGRGIAHMAARAGDAKTMGMLADADLPGLDLALRDREGKIAAEYLAERIIFRESEVGLHANFRRLEKKCKARPVTLSAPDGSSMEVEVCGEEQLDMPGSFPSVATEVVIHSSA